MMEDGLGPPGQGTVIYYRERGIENWKILRIVVLPSLLQDRII